MENDGNDIDVSQESKKPCSGLRKELKDCILASKCVTKVWMHPYLSNSHYKTLVLVRYCSSISVFVC